VALIDIPIGTRLLAEFPVTVEGPGLPPIEELITALSAERRAKFFALAHNELLYPEGKTVEAIIGTNGFPFAVRGVDYGGIFPVMSRINHACDGVAVSMWNSKLGQLTVHASRHIAAGTEITQSYGFESTFCSRDERRHHLASSFGFECTCGKCSLRGEALEASEDRIKGIGSDAAFAAGLAAWDICQPPAPVLERLESRYRLMLDECCTPTPTLTTAPSSGTDGPSSWCSGMDGPIRLHATFCDDAALRLDRMATQLERLPSPTHAMSGAPSPGPEVLRSHAVAFRAAAHRWASVGNVLRACLPVCMHACIGLYGSVHVSVGWVGCPGEQACKLNPIDIHDQQLCTLTKSESVAAC